MTTLLLTGYDMIDREDKIPQCSCGSGDGSDEHDLECELIAEGLL